MRALSREAFAAEAGISPEVVRRLVDIGAIAPLPDGRLAARDEVVATTVRSMLDAGIELDDIEWSLAHGRFGLASLGQIFSEPSPRTLRPYREIAAELGDAARLLPAVHAALGLPEPEPDDHPPTADVEVVMEFIRLWSLVDETGDAHVRVARLIGDATRRIAEGWLDVWDEVARPDPTTQGAPTVGRQGAPTDPTDPEQNPSIGMAALARRMVSLVHERQVETTLNSRIISALERVLGEAGRLPAKPERPPAVAFVDLSSFTTLTDQRGDEEAARMASTLLILAESAVSGSSGRVVKQLGDGVMLRFPDARSAIRCVRALVAQVPDAGLPPAHAGIAAGPIIVRDGDVFGRTVNLAARLSGAAAAGETLAEEGVVVALPPGTARWEAVGRIELEGISDPVAVWRLRAPAAESAPPS